MKKIIILSMICLAVTAIAEPFLVVGKAKDFAKQKNKTVERLIALMNPPELATPTEDNTNNILHGIVFNVIDSTGDQWWMFTGDSANCGGFDLSVQWAEIEEFCFNNKKQHCSWGIPPTEYLQTNGYSMTTNWLTLNIPYVSDIKKVNERKRQSIRRKRRNEIHSIDNSPCTN